MAWLLAWFRELSLLVPVQFPLVTDQAALENLLMTSLDLQPVHQRPQVRLQAACLQCQV